VILLFIVFIVCLWIGFLSCKFKISAVVVSFRAFVMCVQSSVSEDLSIEAVTADLSPDVFVQVAGHLMSTALFKCVHNMHITLMTEANMAFL